jgi:hypothetical protein
MAPPNTNRIGLHRQRQLEPDEKKLVDDVDTYGCHVIQVRPQQDIPGWSYTIGLHEILGQSEIIVIGLKEDLAHSLLNEVTRQMKEGVKFVDSHREKELLANVECEFRTVEQRWLRQAMGYAVWFYEGDDFPVLQCVYPDLENRFPWEAGFDSSWRFRQPLLFHDAPASAVEKGFWSANDSESSLLDWKFAEAPHTRVFTAKRIMNDDDPILYVYHEVADGAWQFHGPSEFTRGDLALVCFHHIVDKDSTIKELADLPIGWQAKRNTASDPWIREPIPPDQEGA